MHWLFRSGLAFVTVALASAPLVAQMSDDAALRTLLRRKLTDAGSSAAKLEKVPAVIFARPYLSSDVAWEKEARTRWYAAQLPANFQATGSIRVVYLTKCGPDLPFLDDESVAAEAAAVFDQEWVTLALERASAAPVDVRGLRRPKDRPFNQIQPDPSIRTLNERLATTEPRLAVFEPYCGRSDRRVRQASIARSVGSPPPPPPPAPPPPEPPASEFFVSLVPGNSLFMISEIRSDLCELSTGSKFTPSCRGWRQISGNPVFATGSRYRYRAERPGSATVTGEFRVSYSNQNPSNPITITQP